MTFQTSIVDDPSQHGYLQEIIKLFIYIYILKEIDIAWWNIETDEVYQTMMLINELKEDIYQSVKCVRITHKKV